MPRRALIIAVIVALIPAAWLTVRRTLDNDSPGSAHSTDKPIPPVSTPASPSATPTVTPTGTPTGTPTVTRTPTKAPTHKPLPHVPVDVPRRISSGNVLDSGFDDSIEPTGDRFLAGSTAEVARWGSRGEPGSPGRDTVYVVGKVDADGNSGFGTLPRIKAGARVSIRTDSGTLTYTVTSIASIRERGIRHNPLFTAKVAGRLVLVGIRYDASGHRGSSYLVLTADLTAAKAS